MSMKFSCCLLDSSAPIVRCLWIDSAHLKCEISLKQLMMDFIVPSSSNSGKNEDMSQMGARVPLSAELPGAFHKCFIRNSMVGEA
jgi:hypothetical protein